MTAPTGPIIDHVSLGVADFAKAKAFYSRALAPLGIDLVAEIPASLTGDVDVAGFGRAGGWKAEFWIAPGSKTEPPIHLAFIAASRAEVDAFHRAALAAGGTDNGAPGIRAHYHPDYYGAFVRDPDGHNIEAVCHGAALATKK